MAVVARRHDLNANRVFKWKRRAETAVPCSPPPEAPDFVPIGVTGRAGDGGPALLARMPGRDEPTGPRQAAEPCRPSRRERRPGVIEIDLPDGWSAR